MVLPRKKAKEELKKNKELYNFVLSPNFTKNELPSNFPAYFDIWWPIFFKNTKLSKTVCADLLNYCSSKKDIWLDNNLENVAVSTIIELFPWKISDKLKLIHEKTKTVHHSIICSIIYNAYEYFDDWWPEISKKTQYFSYVDVQLELINTCIKHFDKWWPKIADFIPEFNFDNVLVQLSIKYPDKINIWLFDIFRKYIKTKNYDENSSDGKCMILIESLFQYINISKIEKFRSIEFLKRRSLNDKK